MFEQLDAENKHIRLRPIPHVLRNWEVLIYVKETDYDHWDAILRNLKANFNLNKFENFSIQFEKQSIISIQSSFSVRL